uniref:non-specific serine/threonine protein kinase n=1 Tax=Chromera velia CCMP2878 TaxID=1169474 RepID=A0A0G4HZW8_9ALVE|eukprot:Cvel_9806.t1-p1 / transcript=Cvel_9806.t1 / gene=Cvel_9806 / organism=Chromera_velia_CCMP2878 / gene_product=hypothetical protein / transcript_product=hypothetical protein / location=Cvel_scaffold575:66040-69807(+) / protein_length=520 / sequence_SO=supercontig / SO=protein_coding / is_pseudo=false
MLPGAQFFSSFSDPRHLLSPSLSDASADPGSLRPPTATPSFLSLSEYSGLRNKGCDSGKYFTNPRPFVLTWEEFVCGKTPLDDLCGAKAPRTSARPEVDSLKARLMAAWGRVGDRRGKTIDDEFPLTSEIYFSWLEQGLAGIAGMNLNPSGTPGKIRDPIVHRDISLENLFVDPDDRLVIGGTAYSIPLSEIGTCTPPASWYEEAPETLKAAILRGVLASKSEHERDREEHDYQLKEAEKKVGTQEDVFSLGVTFFQLCAGWRLRVETETLPWRLLNENMALADLADVYRKAHLEKLGFWLESVEKKDPDFSVMTGCKFLNEKRILQRMLKMDVNERGDAASVLKDEFEGATAFSVCENSYGKDTPPPGMPDCMVLRDHQKKIEIAEKRRGTTSTGGWGLPSRLSPQVEGSSSQHRQSPSPSAATGPTSTSGPSPSLSSDSTGSGRPKPASSTPPTGTEAEGTTEGAGKSPLESRKTQNMTAPLQPDVQFGPEQTTSGRDVAQVWVPVLLVPIASSNETA